MLKKVKAFEFNLPRLHRGLPYVIDKEMGKTSHVHFPFLGDNEKAKGSSSVNKFNEVLRKEFPGVKSNQLKMYSDSSCGLSISIIGS